MTEVIESIDVQTTLAPDARLDRMRQTENSKLDHMEEPLWQALIKQDAKPGELSQIIYGILKVMERRAKLNGLDVSTGAQVNFSHIEIVYKDKASGAVIDAPEWAVHDDSED